MVGGGCGQSGWEGSYGIVVSSAYLRRFDTSGERIVFSTLSECRIPPQRRASRQLHPYDRIQAAVCGAWLSARLPSPNGAANNAKFKSRGTLYVR